MRLNNIFYVMENRHVTTFTALLVGLFLFVLTVPAYALTFNLPASGDNIVGFVRHVHARAGDNFSSIGRRYDIGYYELVEANPDVDPQAIPAGTEIVMPTQFILPATA